MNTNPQVSLIFVNYRSAWYLKKALESLFSFEKEKYFFEVIIVNNDSTEQSTLEELKQTFPFLLIENSENIGFGGGNNIGVRQARGGIVGFINPDVLWIGTYLRGIAGIFDEKKNVGILGMRMLDIDKKEEAWSAGKEPSLANLFRNNIFPLRRSHWKTGELAFSDWVSGGALFIRKNLFSLIGGFDERFFLYFEDVDLCKKVRARGFSVVRHRAYPLIHLGGKSRPSAHLQKTHFYLSQKKYFEKYRPVWENKILRLLQFFFCNNKI